MNKPSILTIAAALAVTAGLVNAASQTPITATPNSVTASAPTAPKTTAPMTLEQTQGAPEQPEAVEEPAGAPDNDAVEQGDQGGADAECGPGGVETPDATEAAQAPGAADTDTAQDCK